ncbi:MAG: GWxTD domain-containing protein ['Candidatus Kapabacteria' thiocyanatum]|uniref:GWxTD domain-containing protein n=1 Tax=Candidatus Kapaibacterium thiocyanatum TaxID=1895771 RepID=A0A1M3KZ68_9BACT|nr:GWxTD domain-containing protein ['Candidatus Kapabacteria' thiocyanatum]OJX57786.1 MAG: hypothetical protein BGO89_07390 ['Candidatus Kapabacteria' thiocyanatum]
MKIASAYRLFAIVAILVTVGIEGSAKELDLVCDVLQFRAQERQVRLEFHYSFPDTALRYVPGQSTFVGGLHFRLMLKTTQGDTMSREWLVSPTSSTPRFEHSFYYTGVQSFDVKPGQYLAELTAYDINDASTARNSTFPVIVRPYTDKVDVSDLMFTTRSTGKNDLDPRFMRNGVEAMPNPRHECIGTDPTISLYSEIYNTKTNKLDSFVVVYEVLDNVRREMMTNYVRQQGLGDALVERVDIPASAIHSGVYLLRMSVKSMDLVTTYAMAEERFYVLNPELPPQGSVMLTEDEQFQASEWAVLEGERLKLQLDLSNVIATPAERITLEGCIDERAKQKYLYRFWRMRDPDPTTPDNERLDDFRKAYQRAQAFYSNPTFKDGWRTDRGRILLRYGIPTQIEQFVLTQDTKPYEVWFYQGLQGGVSFYFVDWQLTQNHRLVHSTYIGEVRDENWFNRYAKAFSPDPNPTESLRPSTR